MKYLIIPDIHNRIGDAENLISAMPGHQPIFLGDYFDHFNDTPEIAGETAKWLAWSISQGRIHLMGNHDLPYRWRHQTCPGFTPEKFARVKREMSPSSWSKVKLFEVIEMEDLRPLLLSHAGFTIPNVYGIQNPLDIRHPGRLSHLSDIPPNEYMELIRQQGAVCLENASRLGDHHWFIQGTRMGEPRQGGPFWIDKDNLMGVLPNIDQIIGHSFVNKPMCKRWHKNAVPNSEVWLIDGSGMFAATVEMEDNGVGGLLVTPIYATGQIGTPIK